MSSNLSWKINNLARLSVWAGRAMDPRPNFLRAQSFLKNPQTICFCYWALNY
ncbi:hypothetical protein HanIR_Chr11g0522531 [Helianthus annuus]|nr:hypothetical protein HanIR_Chr11g0522531 [Helianthus annuus]